MLLITTFVELRVVAGRSRTRAGRPHAVSGRHMLIHTRHAMPYPCRAHAALCRGLSKRHGRCMARAWHGRGTACVNQTRPHCVNQMEKTQSKALAARHGRGTAWVRQWKAWYVWISLMRFASYITCKLQLNLRVRVKYHKAEQIELLNREDCQRKCYDNGFLTLTKHENSSRFSRNVYLLLINL
jgi:hypothetical protein